MSKLVTAILVTALAAGASAQESDPHRHAVALSADAGAFPDAFSTVCGTQNTGGAGFGAGLSVIDRPRPSVIIQGELRASWMPVGFGCDLVLRISEVGPGVYETRPGYIPRPGSPNLPLARTLIRAGLETRDHVGRVTIGAGMIWATHPAPLGSLAVGLASSNRGTRVFGEFEYDISRVRETETRNRFRADSTGETSLGTNVVSRIAYPTWPTLRIGIEVPLP